ncbi:MAG: type II/IV secretion system protein [Candidatus Omnitrophota bacterium]
MSLLIDALLKAQLVTSEQLQDARDKQLGAKKSVEDLIVDMGFVKEKDLIDVASRVFHMDVIDADKEEAQQQALKLVSCDTAKRYGIIPLRIEDGVLVIATSNPSDIAMEDEIRGITGKPVRSVLGSESIISRMIEKYYQLDDSMYDLLKNIVDDTRVELVKATAAGTDALDVADLKGDRAPVVRLVNLILNDGIKARASDIHIEPQENHVVVRYRIDGDLKNIMKVPGNLKDSLIARIKILAELDIAETRKPQDGRTGVLINGAKVDVRISTVPTFFGENVVMRLLDARQAKINLDSLGLEESELRIIRETVTRPQGMVLVTGPTGSGKTSTLYAALNFIKGEKKNIITIEDPIEYLIGGISQIQVSPVKDVTFANGLRSILRQDPNIILVGEIRDRETAEIAFRSSQTGHLVLSTLHTNSAVASITRLRDIGLEPYLIASSLLLIVSQRLVKNICPHCKTEYTPEPALLDKFRNLIGQYRVEHFYRGSGCEKCNFSGYFGRTALFELFQMTDEIKGLISSNAPEEKLIEAAQRGGIRLLAEAGIMKVAQGITTLEEVSRVADVRQEAAQEPSPEFKQEAAAEPPPALKQEPAGKPRLLIADDEEDILKILEKRLTDSGYAVTKAVNGKEAVELAVKDQPDLIITDAMMPVMDGFEAVKMLRARLQTAGIPIIMLTARKDKEGELEGFESGADDYITKPYDKDKLLARIRMLLARRARLNG